MVEAGKRAGLVDEALESPGETLAVVFGYGMHGEVAFPYRHLNRQVFLHRHLLVEIRVFGQIGDAESALAEDLFDPVPVHHIAGLEGVAVVVAGHGDV